ncbi:hypothetical protein P3H15_47945 [Rhodococcus sp. T2V]|uniref:hypothetical protein n=1 Tax=Rhodococcus sp. T2V TaxID=3034164 RepID=UPI0023E321BC|nr:hypothetical protein [Rhodococcus sp. T2V]MDF3312681.1 hypothetical protein [Rhodococcus sp. T2V]
MTVELDNTDTASEATVDRAARKGWRNITWAVPLFDPLEVPARRGVLLRWGLQVFALGVLVATGTMLGFPVWFVIVAVTTALAAVFVTYKGEVALTRPTTAASGGNQTMAVLAILAASTTAFALVSHFQRTVIDEQAVQIRLLAAEKAGELTASVLTYKAATVDDDVTEAKTHLTGAFLNSYSALTADTIIPQAKQDQVDTHWEASGTSVITAEPDSATVLVFLRGTTVSAANPDPTYLFSSVRVQVEECADQWRISQLEPL